MNKIKQPTNHYNAWLESGLTPDEYSQRVGISKQTIYYWKRKTIELQIGDNKSPKSGKENAITKESWIQIPVEEESHLFSFKPQIEISITQDWEFILKVRFI